jgi:glutathione-specific gamma-glutamylcyclotransferase
MMDPSFWIFGYGSLIWRPSFDFLERSPAYAVGWTRRFWQGSTDHRGTPEAPGRVVTLVPEAKSRCWGVAYRIPGRERDTVLEELDRREQGGYSRCELEIFLSSQRSVPQTASTYVAQPDNPHYLGTALLSDIARQIQTARGPSGKNRDYLFELKRALDELGARDDHVFELAQLVAPESVKIPRTTPDRGDP